MTIGLSTYAFTWRAASNVPQPATLSDMLDETADLGGRVFQICDYSAIERYSTHELAELRRKASDLGIALELGTRGIGYDKLTRYLDLAEALDVRLLRSMFNDGETRPTPTQAERSLHRILPRLESQHVKLALETYEQVPVKTMMSVIEAIDSPYVGVCLDPANCVAALEFPAHVIAQTADHVVNLHIKDFTFTRTDGWIGFRLLGCPLGEGLLELDSILERIAPQDRDINLIIEHWLDWQGDTQTTHLKEAEWTHHNMNLLRSKQP